MSEAFFSDERSRLVVVREDSASSEGLLMNDLLEKAIELCEVGSATTVDGKAGQAISTLVEWLWFATVIVIPTCVGGAAVVAVSVIVEHTHSYGPALLTLLLFGSLFYLISSNRASEQKGFLVLKLLLVVGVILLSLDVGDQTKLSSAEFWARIYSILLDVLAILVAIPSGIVLGKLFPKHMKRLACAKRLHL